MTQLEIAQLPLSAKLELMESLWDSLCREPATEDSIPPWHQTLLDDRLRGLDAGQEEIIPWDEAKQRIRAAARG